MGAALPDRLALETAIATFPARPPISLVVRFLWGVIALHSDSLFAQVMDAAPLGLTQSVKVESASSAAVEEEEEEEEDEASSLSYETQPNSDSLRLGATSTAAAPPPV